MNDVTARLRALLAPHLSPEAATFLDQALHGASCVEDGSPERRPEVVPARATFLRDFAAAPRKLGKGPVGPGDAGGTALPPGLTVDELGRAALLSALPAAEQVPLVEECYRHGELRERRAILRALPLLPAPERFVALAVDACRTHVEPVFEAICCDNPYPAACFPDASFFQMVLKALFIGVPLERVIGLGARTTPELVRMVRGYESERRAAGRVVPADIERFFGAAPPAIAPAQPTPGVPSQ